MLKRILVTGKNGQLGQSLQKLADAYPQFGFTFVGHNELDLSSSESIRSFFDTYTKSFNAIINCAAYTAVDKAESEPKLAEQVNHLAVKQLAEISKAQGAYLVHISTDYVFNGENYKPYKETDSSEPRSVYGDTKLQGEKAMQEVEPAGCIIRTSWVYSEFGNNFVKTMVRLGKERDSLNVIFDQVGSPTYATDLARVILEILCHPIFDMGSLEDSVQLARDPHARHRDDESVNIYHFSNEGVCSWFDFAKAIFELSAIDCKVNPIETKDYPTPAKRPHYSLMNKAKIKADFNLEIPYWRDSLKNCLKN